MKSIAEARLGLHAKVAAVAAFALLLVMALFDWFETDAGSVNAWQAFTVIDLILLVAAAAAIALAVTGAGRGGQAPAPVAFAATSLALLGLTLILFRILDPPDLDANAITKAVDVFGVDGSEARIGSYLGAIVAAAMTWAGWASMNATQGAGASRIGRGPAGQGEKEPKQRSQGLKQRPERPKAPAKPKPSTGPQPVTREELPATRTAAQRAADRAERRRQSQSSSD